MSRALLALILLVGTSGCLGSLAGGPTLDDVSMPPGVNESGTNASALASAHKEALHNHNFTIRIDIEQHGGSGEYNGTVIGKVGAKRDRILVSSISRIQNEEEYAYLTAEKEYNKRVENGKTTFDVGPRITRNVSISPISYTYAREVRRQASFANYTPSRAREINGTTVIVLEAGLEDIDPNSNVNASSFSGVMHVDERGVVQFLKIEFVGESEDGKQTEFTFTLRVFDIDNTTVTEPDWVEHARENASADSN